MILVFLRMVLLLLIFLQLSKIRHDATNMHDDDRINLTDNDSNHDSSNAVRL